MPPKSWTLIGGIFMRKNKKHSFEFRLQIVEDVIKRRYSIEDVSRKEHIHHSVVERWVAFYRKFGINGLRPIRNAYSNDFRLKVVKAMKSESLSLPQACLRFKIPSASTILNWIRVYDSGGLEGLLAIRKGRPTTMPRKPKRPLTREEQLLEELADLRAENAYLKKLRALIQSENEKEEKRKSSKN